MAMAPESPDTMRTTNPGQKAWSSRSKWTNRIEGKLALIASIASPFDYLTMPAFYFYFGGGVVFIPLFVLFLGLVGVPMMLLEVGVGQFMDRGTWCAWNIAPLFKGIGYLQTIINGQIVWVWMWYLMSQLLFCYDLGTTDREQLSSFSHCQDVTENPNYVDEFGLYENFTYDTLQPCQPKSPWSDRWTSLEYGASTEGAGQLDGAQVLVMMLAFLLVCGIVAAGKRVIGKLSAICVILPYLLTLMLFVRVLTLPGASSGLMYGFYPNWWRFLEPDTWLQAAAFALYFCAAGQGVGVTVGSHNRFNNNFLLDCLLAVIVKFIMGIFIACTMLGAYGVAAHAVNRSFSDVISGSVMVLPVLTEAFVLHTPAGGFWAACLLISLLLSTLSGTVWAVESAVVAIRDLLPRTPRFRLLRKKHVLIAVFAIPWCGYGLLYCTKDTILNGNMQNNKDYVYIASMLLLISTSFIMIKGSFVAISRLHQSIASRLVVLLLCLLECAAIGWLYGARRFQTNWAAMQGCCGCPYPMIFWAIITPIVLFVLLILSLILLHFPYEWPALCSFVFALLLVVISAIVLLATRPGTLRQKWKIMTTPWDLAPHQLQPQNRRYDTIAMTTVAN